MHCVYILTLLQEEERKKGTDLKFHVHWHSSQFMTAAKTEAQHF